MCSEWSQFLGGESADEGSDDDAPAAPLTVSALLAQVKGALSAALPDRVTVVGELSNFKRHSSGHMYFRLKDSAATIDAAMFRGRASKLKFTPTDGLEVVVEGRVDVYETRGQLQLYVERMTPRGAGALELAFRQLCDKLRAEGLFDPAAKKPIARLPRGIGVITSPTGAALRDIRRTLARRWGGATVYLLGALVQGDHAAADVAGAIALLDANAQRLGIETIIVARGGGSIEDLWAFNEEPVARAIFTCNTPVICGVGHENDVTIADMAADCRAATPTAAAELAVPDAAELRQVVDTLGARLARGAGEHVRSARRELEAVLRSAVFRDPAARVRTQMQRTDEMSHRMASALRGRLARDRARLEPAANRLAALHPAHRAALARQQLASLARQLEAMSYRSVLARGFSVTRKTDGTILRSVDDVRNDEVLRTELADGTIDSVVIADRTAPPRGKPRRDEDSQRQAPPAERTTQNTAQKTKAKQRVESDEPMLFNMEED